MNRVLVLAHREELIYQAVGHAKAAGQTAGIEMGSERAKREKVVVSTVQTLNAKGRCRVCGGGGCDVCENKGRAMRMTKFDPCEFGLVITDEAHHGTAKSYRRIYKYFGQNPRCKFLHVTATPKRTDGVGMHNVVDSVAYQMDLVDAIHQGWLCPIRQRFITVDGLNLSQVKTKAGGDLADGELERAFLGESTEDEERMLHEVAAPTVQEAAGRATLMFCPGVEYAQKMTAALNAYDGVNAECVIGATDKDERKRIIERYKQRKTQILVGVGVFTEGFDAPGTVVVANVRPTKSESLYLQIIGRGTRPLPGTVDGWESDTGRRNAIACSDKPACIVLDFVGNAGRHKLVSVADVLSGESVPAEDLSWAVEEAAKSTEPVDMEELIEKAKANREAKQKREEEERQRRLSTRTYADHVDYTATDIGIGQSFDPFSDYQPGPSQATQKQVNLLVKLGINPETAVKYSKRQAGAVITSLKNKSGGDYIMTFGKHKGKALKDLPGGYVRWLHNLGKSEVNQHIEDYWESKQVEHV